MDTSKHQVKENSTLQMDDLLSEINRRCYMKSHALIYLPDLHVLDNIVLITETQIESRIEGNLKTCILEPLQRKNLQD